MSSTYSGNAAAVQSPAPAWAPGSTPVITLPADADPLNAASVAQMVKVPVDGLTFVQTAVKLDIPITNAGGVGFSAITYNAFGGTVAPSGSVKINTGTRFMIKIILGGAVGTATFQASMDGGNTYGATQTTAASMTDATSGITLAFSGTMTANGTAAFRSAFTPQQQVLDPSSNVRGVVDFNGYRTNHGLLELREDWIGTPATIGATSTPIANFTRWSAFIGGGAGINMAQTPTSGYPGPFENLNLNTTNGSVASLYTAVQLTQVTANSVIVLEFDIGFVFNGTWSAWMGLWTTRDPSANAAGQWACGFKATSAAANWKAQTVVNQNESAGTLVDTGVAVAGGATDPSPMRCKIVVCGASTPLGRVALFFLNESLVASSSADLTTGTPQFNIVFELFSGASSSTPTMYVGEVIMAANKRLSLPAI